MVGIQTETYCLRRETIPPRPPRTGWSVSAVACALCVFLLPALSPAQNDDQQPAAKPAPAAASKPGQEPGDKPAAAWRMRLTLPVTAKTYKQVQRFAVTARDQASAAQQRPVLIFEFHVPPGQSEFGRGSEFGPSYQLAEFISGGKLAAATTVAFVPATIQGHAVLVAMACDEIVMAPDAEIGVAGVDEDTITNTIRFTYEDVASRKRRIPGGAAMALVDPALELLRVETEYSTEYVTRKQFAQLKEKKHTIDGSEEILIRAGEPGRFSGREARRHGFISYLGENLRDVARAMNLRPESIQEDPALGANWIAARVNLVGPITGEAVNRAQRMIEDAIRERGVNFICLWLDTEGGAPAESARLAIFLASALDASEVRTVAYVPKQAGADAALIALACDELVIAPRAVLGGGWKPPLSEEQVHQLSQTVRDTLAPGKSRSWSLPTAMVDPKLDVFAYQRLDEVKYVEYFCEEEAAEQIEPDAWLKGEAITTSGEPLSVTGTVAGELWLADHEAQDFTSFKRHYGLENDPALLEPGWADFLIEALASPPVAIFLLVIGFAALYVELQAPGIGIGGFCAAVCFIVFFWSRFLGGTAGWLEVILFLAGICFLLVEIFVLPGFGIFGLGGGAMVLASIVLASQTFVLPNTTEQLEQLKGSLFVLTGAGVGSIVLIMFIQRWLPALSPANEAREATRHEMLVDYDDLLGSHGTTTTQLTPSGKARFHNRVVDVITECEVVERGCRVEVVEVRGNRVFVRSVT
jgi:membrane-bound serine protease (ClpP class)